MLRDVPPGEAARSKVGENEGKVSTLMGKCPICGANTNQIGPGLLGIYIASSRIVFSLTLTIILSYLLYSWAGGVKGFIEITEPPVWYLPMVAMIRFYIIYKYIYPPVIHYLHLSTAQEKKAFEGTMQKAAPFWIIFIVIDLPMMIYSDIYIR